MALLASEVELLPALRSAPHSAWGMLLFIGVLGTAGHLMLVLAFQRAPADFRQLGAAQFLVHFVALALGQAFDAALGGREGIVRMGESTVPLDEALSRVVIDLSGRPGLVYNIDFTRAAIGQFDVDLFSEFFHGFVNHAMVTLHIDNLRGVNAHHQAETVFKAFGRALRMAVEPDPRMAGVTPSTKGTLTA